jgi:hypothetical protein
MVWKNWTSVELARIYTQTLLKDFQVTIQLSEFNLDDAKLTACYYHKLAILRVYSDR